MELNITDSKEVWRILPFYADATVFVTGSSGFVGMTLVESLLRKTNVRKIYVLLRSKKDKSAEDRFKEILGGEIFTKIRNDLPDRLSAVELLKGDVCAPDLGMDEGQAAKAIQQVEIIFHVAASVQFNANIKLATAVNVSGARNVMEFAKKVHNLKVIMHVSTAYVNEHKTELEERIYPMENVVDTEKLAESVCDDTANEITKKVIGESSNSYVYTKRVTELMIEKHYNRLPVGIFRPGAVLGAIRDPLPGWISNLYGPTGLVVGLMTGKVHVLIGTGDSFAEVVPVDLVSNCLISAAADTSYRYQWSDGESMIPVYNVVSSQKAPVSWPDFMKIVVDTARKEPCKSMVWYPFQVTTSNWFMYRIMVFLFHYIHAFIIDRVVGQCGNKMRCIQMYQQIDKVSEFLFPFCNKRRVIYTHNVQLLWKKMNEDEQELFPFDMENFQWNQYISLYMKGIRKFVLNEEENEESYKRTAIRLLVYHCSTIILTSSIFIGILYIICSL